MPDPTFHFPHPRTVHTIGKAGIDLHAAAAGAAIAGADVTCGAIAGTALFIESLAREVRTKAMGTRPKLAAKREVVRQRAAEREAKLHAFCTRLDDDMVARATDEAFAAAPC